MASSKNPKHKILILAALGVVYGDLGTSPLYALKESFRGQSASQLTQPHIFGVLSMIFWFLIIIITAKYVLFIMHADNQGEGGILALMQLVLPKKSEMHKRYVFILIIGLFGAALLYGDGILTPAISVMSAVEGIKVATPALERYIVPITIVILIALFLLQSKGSGSIGKLFGPIMLLWFSVMAAIGVFQIIQNPEILKALNPYYAIKFVGDEGWEILTILGAVFLVVTGGESLYVDMGHFGPKPIRWAWFTIVLPGLVLNYFGQGALLLRHPGLVKNPFYHAAPEWALIPLIVLGTTAAIIASQAVISGAFSLTFQAIQLNYLPRLRIFHTSTSHKGQVYLPHVNFLLLVLTVVVVLLFQSSDQLSVAYGIGITITMVVTDFLAFYAMRYHWKWKLLAALGVMVFFLFFDLSFMTANILKFMEGGWFPILLALIVFALFRIWITRQERVRNKFSKYDEELPEFVDNLNREDYCNVNGAAVYLTSVVLDTPMALQYNLKHNKSIHKKILILQIGMKKIPKVKKDDRMNVQEMGNGFCRVLFNYGYMEKVSMYHIMDYWQKDELLEPYCTDEVTFFLSKQTIYVEHGNFFNRLGDSIYIFMRTNSVAATRYFNIPKEQVFEVGRQVEI